MLQYVFGVVVIEDQARAGKADGVARVPIVGHVGRHFDAFHLDHVVGFLAEQAGHMLTHARVGQAQSQVRQGAQHGVARPARQGPHGRRFRHDGPAVGAQQVQCSRFWF